MPHHLSIITDVQSVGGDTAQRALTPLMKQYKAIKLQHPGALLLFRVGDFYETFEEDAHKLHAITEVKLTKRANGSAASVALAGFPHHALDVYLPKLVRAGLRVAICDQLEPPQKGKEVVARAVTELVTPGLAYHEQVLDKKTNNYLASIHFDKEACGIAFLDLSTGEFLVGQGSREYIIRLIQRFQPAEIIFNKNYRTEFSELLPEPGHHYMLSDWVYEMSYAYQRLNSHFGTTTLKGFGIESLPLGVIAAGAVLRYLEEAEHRNLRHINTISRIEEDQYVWLDKFTIRNLELLTPQHEEGVALLQVLDKTVTPMGGRTLRKWIVLPLKERAAIQHRLDCVTALVNLRDLAATLTHHLQQVGDLERLISKVAAKRIKPYELIALQQAMAHTLPLQRALQQTEHAGLQALARQLHPCSHLVEKIERVLNPDPASITTQGGLIRSGVYPELDQLRTIACQGNLHLADIQEEERKKTGITSLKISYNRVFGYYLEVRNTHKTKVPSHWIRKQTLVGSERYSTDELKEYERQILNAQEQIQVLELRYYNALVDEIAVFVPEIQHNSKILGQLDCYQSFAQLAVDHHYIAPILSDDNVLDIKQGRHPVIERYLPPDQPYEPNDLYLDPQHQQIMLITGPNMSGKSSFLRQVPLIVLMAQVGSFVPASYALIGLVDKISIRVGAWDNVARRESTFMVEMNETASIVNNLSHRSLVVIDELGRGTGTADGLALAQSVLEYLHNHPQYQAKTLFATHYHELNELAATLPRLKNYKVAVKEAAGQIFFLHKVVPGSSQQSFGTQVARMAGMPAQIIARACELLASRQGQASTPAPHTQKAAQPRPSPTRAEQQAQRLLEALEQVDINTLTPIEALVKLEQLQGMVNERKGGCGAPSPSTSGYTQ